MDEAPLLQLYVYDPVPPDAVAVTLPLLFPQVVLAAEAFAVSSVGCVIVTTVVDEQELLSVMVIVYVLLCKLPTVFCKLVVDELAPLLHVYL